MNHIIIKVVQDQGRTRSTLRHYFHTPIQGVSGRKRHTSGEHSLR